VFIAAAPHVVRRIGERLTSEIQDGPRSPTPQKLVKPIS
jgi:hypothetical protein